MEVADALDMSMEAVMRWCKGYGKTKDEKAIKVLDMIQNKYLETTTIWFTEDVIGRCLPKAVCFQMPLDSEV